MLVARSRALCLFVFAAFASPVATAQGPLPEGWHQTGANREEFEVGVDRTTPKSGSASGYVRSKSKSPKPFGALMQEFRADAYRGKRVRMTAFIKAEVDGEKASLWMRVDTPRGITAFDNMDSRAITTKSDWTKYEIVLDVDEDAIGIAFGAILGGAGTVWVDDFVFGIADQSVASTDMKIPQPAQQESVAFVEKMKEVYSKRGTEPRNLGFEPEK